MYYIVSFVCRSLVNNVKAAIEGARVGLVEEVEEEVREARMDLLQEEKLQVFKRSRGDNLSFILKSTLISDVYISLVQVPTAQQP